MSVINDLMVCVHRAGTGRADCRHVCVVCESQVMLRTSFFTKSNFCIPYCLTDTIRPDETDGELVKRGSQLSGD